MDKGEANTLAVIEERGLDVRIVDLWEKLGLSYLRVARH